MDDELFIPTETVFISGASYGIGQAAANRFAELGYNLILTCSSSFPRLQEIAANLEEEYEVSCRAYCTDMGDFDAVKRVFDEITELDILINNAGISYVGLLTEMEAVDWHHLMQTNIDSCFYTSKLAIPLMLKKQAGKILNVSSVWGTVGASMETAYSASKGAVNSFTKALAKELAPSNIQVNAIACGAIDTRMNAHLNGTERRSLMDDIPAGRLGTADEVARLLLLMAGAPDYMTGQIITMDGGWT